MKFFNNIIKKTDDKSVTLQYKVEGTSFDRKTTNGLNNFLTWKSLNSDYLSKRVGYLFVSSASILTSVYGGFVMGTLIFIIASVMIESIKLMMGRDKRDIVILASIISLSFALYGLYKTIDTENQSQTNKHAQVKVLQNSIASADKQIKALQDSKPRPIKAGKPPSFDQAAYKDLVRRLTLKDKELSRLKKEYHTYWQKRPSRRNKKTGSWMLANPDKCTGTYCPKLQAKAAHVDVLVQEKKAMDAEKARVQAYQDRALNMEQEKAKIEQRKQATIQRLINNRDKDQRTLLSLQSNVKVPVDVEVAMTLLFLLLVFVERYQYTTGNSLSDMKNHRLKVNTMYRNYQKKIALQKDAEVEYVKPKESRGWLFSKKVVDNTTQQKTESVNEHNLSNEAKRVRKILVKAGHHELFVTGKLTDVHVASLLKNRNLEKEVGNRRREGETMEKTLLGMLQDWNVTTSRLRGKELSAEFKKGMK